MITFCQIWQANNFHFFVSIYRVMNLCTHVCYEKCTCFCMSLFWQKSFSENKNVQKRDMRMPVWAVLGRFMSLFRQNLFSENKKPRFWDMIQPILPPPRPSPENGKSDFRKTRNPVFGTCNRPHTFYPRPRPSPENGKTFFRKTRMPQKGTLIICQNVNNIWQTVLKI